MSDWCDGTRIACELPRMKRHHKRQGVIVVCQRHGCNKLFKAVLNGGWGDPYWEWEEIRGLSHERDE